MHNHLKTLFFLMLLSALLMALGQLFGGVSGLAVGCALAVLLNIAAYWFSDRIVLAMHQAQEVHPGDSQGLYEMIERLVARAVLPMPRIYIVPDHSPNAFATGRTPYHATIAVTQGLLGILNYQELEGILAHELAHVKNRDTLIGTIAAAFAAPIMTASNLSRWAPFDDGKKGRVGAFGLLLAAILAPIAAAMIQFASSRSREYSADALGARICGNSEWLANALRKIHNMSASLPLRAGGPATAHLYVVNPFSGMALLSLFSTHPPVEERIARLLQIRTEH